MSYVDIVYYKETFKGSIADEYNLLRAEADIDTLTYNRIVKKGFDNLTPFQQGKIKNAVCLHAEFLTQYSDMIESPLSGYSAGSTSVSFKAVTNIGGINTTERVIGLLDSTGLTTRLFI